VTTLDSTVPYPWPFDGILDPARLALVVVGAQAAWAARSSRVADVARVLALVADEVRAAGGSVIVVRHSRPVGSRRSAVLSAVDDDASQLVFPFCPSDVLVDAAGIDGFYGGPLDDVLRSSRVDHLVLGGYGHEAAVDSTLRSANDRGYECLVLTDGVAPFDEQLGAHALHSVTMSGGIFGAVGTSDALISAISRVPMEAVL
jgi:biuret amidohydrolase